MATAPFQLWLDLAPIASAIAVGGTVTVTTSSAHGMTAGAYVQVDGLTAAGTAFNTVAQVATTPSGTAFTYVLGSVSGTATVTAGCLSYDLLNPPINYASGTAREQALIAQLDSLNLSSNGDGSGSSMSLSVMQETTPAGTPWFTLIPDNTRLRLAEKNTGSTPGTADIRFIGLLYAVDSRLTGSGQGSISSLTVGDSNTLLDRLGVFGQTVATKSLQNGAATRASNVTTISFPGRAGVPMHGFKVGQQVKVSGLSGGRNASFNGIFTVASVPDLRSFTYANTGTADTSGGRSFTVTRKSKTTDRLTLTATAAPGNTTNYFNLTSGDTIYVRGISGFAGSGWTSAELTAVRLTANGYFSGDQVNVINAYTIELVLPKPITGTGTFNTGAYLIGTSGQAGPPIVNGQMIVKINAGASEDDAVKQFLTLVNAYKATDYPVQRLFGTSGTAQITGGTAFANAQEVQFPASNLRSALDAIVETYQGNDIKDRRYFLDVNGNLNYSLVDSTTKPTYATAPYAIVTASAGSPNTSTAKATVAPYNLTVTYDHETTKAGMFTIPAVAGASLSQIWSYQDLSNDPETGTAIFSERKGAPVLDAVVDFPTAVKNPGAQIARAAAAYFTERHKPGLTINFELRGAGQAAWNTYGFTSGYAQTGASTFALVSGWRVGQWCEIVAAGLGINGLFRVEQVNWGLEPGSYIQRVQIVANRKPAGDLATNIAGLRG
ncbi:hypothetical protein UFOVP1573_37 [uncultured Caudovirales phage]|uniref:Uncharacterized protein n=1 Tax=uncultured Caudovirales phage TaxID=2100421 RepID=A0A6J7XRC4_9CAUD|nr:hypothetical protein UFOVP1126_22 [uncultured Caudovirales phage]CAB4215448.1 hypothetical protein UFOVP1485_22 [uncultured Caudovirales phage]CAB5230566.1 hypothetical protein UFOVP1573_37 [uncultured Caudovirales phage]